MKIVGYSGDITFKETNGRDTFSIKHAGKHLGYDGKWTVNEPTEGQLHIPKGLFSKMTGFMREYFLPCSWRSIYLERDGQTQRVLIHYRPNTWVYDSQLICLEGESPYWAKAIGNGRLIKSKFGEYLVAKNVHWMPQLVGFKSFDTQKIGKTRDGFVPIWRVRNLLERIQRVCWIVFSRVMDSCTRWMVEVESPSSGERFFIKPMDFKLACQIMGENLSFCDRFFHHEQLRTRPDRYFDEDNPEVLWMLAENSTVVNWVTSAV